MCKIVWNVLDQQMKLALDSKNLVLINLKDMVQFKLAQKALYKTKLPKSASASQVVQTVSTVKLIKDLNV